MTSPCNKYAKWGIDFTDEMLSPLLQPEVNGGVILISLRLHSSLLLDSIKCSFSHSYTFDTFSAITTAFHQMCRKVRDCDSDTLS